MEKKNLYAVNQTLGVESVPITEHDWVCLLLDEVKLVGSSRERRG